MQTSLYVSTASQSVLQKQLEVIANNVANTNTIGFQAEGVDFKTLVSKTGESRTSYPSVSDVHHSDNQGVLKETGNSLDIALSGPGYFSIQTPHGTAYTRDGRIKIDQFGQLSTVNGYPVMDAGGSPILIQANGEPPKISDDGRVTQAGIPVANIGVFEVPRDQIDRRFENSSFFAKSAGVPIATGSETKIIQGFVESSNVNPMRELANLIAVTRSFEHAAKTIEKVDQSVAMSVRELGATSV